GREGALAHLRQLARDLGAEPLHDRRLGRAIRLELREEPPDLGHRALKRLDFLDPARLPRGQLLLYHGVTSVPDIRSARGRPRSTADSVPAAAPASGRCPPRRPDWRRRRA